MEDSFSGLGSAPQKENTGHNDFVTGKENDDPTVVPASVSILSRCWFWKWTPTPSSRASTSPVNHSTKSANATVASEEISLIKKLLENILGVILMMRTGFNWVFTYLALLSSFAVSSFVIFMLLGGFTAAVTLGLNLLVDMWTTVVPLIVYWTNQVVITLFWLTLVVDMRFLLLGISILVPLMQTGSGMYGIWNRTWTSLPVGFTAKEKYDKRMQEFKDARARGKRKFSKKEFKLFRRELESLTKLEPERKKKAWYYIGILIQFFATIVWTFSTTVLDHEWISINQVLLLLSSPVMLLFIVNYLYSAAYTHDCVGIYSFIKHVTWSTFITFLFPRVQFKFFRWSQPLTHYQRRRNKRNRDRAVAAEKLRAEEEAAAAKISREEAAVEILRQQAAAELLRASQARQSFVSRPAWQGIFIYQRSRSIRFIVFALLFGSTVFAADLNPYYGSAYINSLSPPLASPSSRLSPFVSASTSKRSRTTTEEEKESKKAEKSPDIDPVVSEPEKKKKKKKKQTSTEEEPFDERDLDYESAEDYLSGLGKGAGGAEVDEDITEIMDDIAATDDCGLDNDEPEEECASDNGPTRVSPKILPSSMLRHFPSISAPLLHPGERLPSNDKRPGALLEALAAHRKELPRKLDSDEAEAANQSLLNRYKPFSPLVQYLHRPNTFFAGDLLKCHAKRLAGTVEFVAGFAPRGLSLFTYPVDQTAGDLVGKATLAKKSPKMFKKSNWSAKLPTTPVPKTMNHSFDVTKVAHSLLPKELREFMMAMDTDPIPRDNDLGSKLSRVHTLWSAMLAFESISRLKIKEVVIHQAFNRRILIEYGIIPNGKFTRDDGKVIYCWEEDGQKEEYEKTSGKVVKLSQLSAEEKEKYWWNDVLDVGDKSTSAIFVKNFRGRHSIIFIFAPHPCIIDPGRHIPVLVNQAIGVIEAAYRRLAKDLSNAFTLMTPEFNTSVASLVPGTATEPPLRTAFPNNGKGFFNAYGRNGTIADMIILRKFEIKTGKRSDPATWSPVLRDKVIKACGDYYEHDESEEKGREHDSVNPHLHPSLPHSNLALALQSAVLGKLTNLAGYEMEEENGVELSQRKQDVLESCRKAPWWRMMLRTTYGLTTAEATSDRRFLIAHERRAERRLNDPVWQARLRYSYAMNSFNGSRPHSLHLWSPHHWYSIQDFGGNFDYQNLIRYFSGFNSTPHKLNGQLNVTYGLPAARRSEAIGVEVERHSRYSFESFKLEEQCDDCKAEGLRCLMTYEEGIEWMLETQGEEWEEIEGQLLNFIIALEKKIRRLYRKLEKLDFTTSINKDKLYSLNENLKHFNARLENIERILAEFGEGGKAELIEQKYCM